MVSIKQVFEETQLLVLLQISLSKDFNQVLNKPVSALLHTRHSLDPPPSVGVFPTQYHEFKDLQLFSFVSN